MEGVSNDVVLVVIIIIFIVGYIIQLTFKTQPQQSRQSNPNPNRNNSPNSIECPICLQNQSQYLISTCNHSFCIQCINNYLNNLPDFRQLVRGISCPLCRRTITIFFIQSENNDSDVQSIRSYNQLYGGQSRSILETIQQLPLLIRQMIRFSRTTQGLNFLINNFNLMINLVIVGLYVISPFDLISESIVGIIGYIDDMIVLLAVLVTITNTFMRYYAAL